jgi:iron complex transport system substrate-binding protein
VGATPQRPSARVSRRTVALFASLLVPVASCRTSGAGTDPGKSSSPPSTGSFPATVEHRYGRTTISTAPKRVAVVGLMEQDALLALGIAPVAATEWFGEYPGAIWPWARDKLAGRPDPTVLSFADGIQFEKVAALRPDLIVGIYSALKPDDYETLSKIAPTIAQPVGSNVDWTASWQEVTVMVGTAVGLRAKAQSLVDEVEGVIAKHAADNPSFKGRTGLVATPYEGFYVYGAKDPRGRLLQSLGFAMPEGLDEVVGKEFGANLSSERTRLLDVDALVWLLEAHDADRKRIESNRLYAGLAVSREGRDVFVAGDKAKAYYGSTSFISVLSLPMLLDRLVPQLAAAVDGDIDTPVSVITEPVS